MKNSEKLCKALASKWKALERKEITCQEAAEFTNMAGKMINAAKAELEHAVRRGDIPDVKFLRPYPSAGGKRHAD